MRKHKGWHMYTLIVFLSRFQHVNLPSLLWAQESEYSFSDHLYHLWKGILKNSEVWSNTNTCSSINVTLLSAPEAFVYMLTTAIQSKSHRGSSNMPQNCTTLCNVTAVQFSTKLEQQSWKAIAIDDEIVRMAVRKTDIASLATALNLHFPHSFISEIFVPIN